MPLNSLKGKQGTNRRFTRTRTTKQAPSNGYRIQIGRPLTYAHVASVLLSRSWTCHQREALGEAVLLYSIIFNMLLRKYV